MLGKSVAISSIVAAVLLAVLLETTTPADVGPAGLLAVFFLLYVFLVGVITALSWLLNRITVKVSRLVTVRKPLSTVSLKKLYYLSSVLALGPVMMLAMKSIGSLGVYEIILVTLFLSIATLYVNKRDI